MKSTNYYNTFIEVAADCPINAAEVPPSRGERKTIANLQFDLISERPYELTSDDVLFHVYSIRNQLQKENDDQERQAFFSRGQPCLRSSPLPKRYGWGIHCDEKGKVALYAVESVEYAELSQRKELKQVKAMRTNRQ